MDEATDFEDRLAARLLGVPVEADANAIRGRFRSLVKAVHPDRTLLEGCIDLGSLAEARDQLLARASRRSTRQSTARAHLDVMRLAATEPPQAEAATAVATADPQTPASVETWRPMRSVVTERIEPARLGSLIDLAG